MSAPLASRLHRIPGHGWASLPLETKTRVCAGFAAAPSRSGPSSNPVGGQPPHSRSSGRGSLGLVGVFVVAVELFVTVRVAGDWFVAFQVGVDFRDGVHVGIKIGAFVYFFFRHFRPLSNEDERQIFASLLSRPSLATPASWRYLSGLLGAAPTSLRRDSKDMGQPMLSQPARRTPGTHGRARRQPPAQPLLVELPGRPSRGDHRLEGTADSSPQLAGVDEKALLSSFEGGRLKRKLDGASAVRRGCGYGPGPVKALRPSAGSLTAGTETVRIR